MPDFFERSLIVHEQIGGKLAVTGKLPLRNRDDLSIAYTPGVAAPCEAIAKDVSRARDLTIKRNSVAVVSDGSAVLGLGNIGPHAAIPVMEGKALLFREFAQIDAWPICVEIREVDEIIATVRAGLWRHQPGGHLRAAMLRDRARSPGPRHSRLPR